MDKKQALEYLKKDPVMKGLIAIYKLDELKAANSLFEDLVDAIISQQLSTKAAQTIFKRFKSLFGGEFPEAVEILKTPDEKLRACGISYSKISYIKGIAKEVEAKTLQLNKLPDLSDEEVLRELIRLKGIGKWTAEMILIFSLKRPDVFSVGDLGLRNAVSKLYKVERDDLVKIEKISLKWKPFRSTAARYLWKSLDTADKVG